MSTVTVKFQRHADDVVLPDYATPGSHSLAKPHHQHDAEI